MKNILDRIMIIFNYYIIHHGNKISYLRSKGASIGDNCDILTKVNYFGSEPWLISIGNEVTITAGVILITHDGSSRVFRKKFSDMNMFGNKFGKITIGNNCFIGINSLILPGVSIGENSIVGVGSIVTKSVPPNTVVVGSPARVICSLDEYIERYRKTMIQLKSTTRQELREELTWKLN